jgi:hypothetical protein
MPINQALQNAVTQGFDVRGNTVALAGINRANAQTNAAESQNALSQFNLSRGPAVEQRAQNQDTRLQGEFESQQEEDHAREMYGRLFRIRTLIGNGDLEGARAENENFRDPALRDNGRRTLAIDGSNPGDQDLVDQAMKNMDDLIAEGFTRTGRDGKPLLQAPGSGMPAELQTFDAMTQNLSPEDVERARRVDLGLDSRAATIKTVESGGVKYYNDPNPNSPTFGKLIPLTIDGKPVTAESTGESEGIVAASVKAGEQAVIQSGKIFEQLAPVGTSIANMQDAKRLLGEGARTGAVQSLFPSISAASVALDNVQGQMGLDVIGATTFGALSESELAFALATALPTGLDEPELEAWLDRKIEAQQKLQEELRKAATYLGKPGNTVASYLEALELNGMYEKGPGGDSLPPIPEGYTRVE